MSAKFAAKLWLPDSYLDRVEAEEEARELGAASAAASQPQLPTETKPTEAADSALQAAAAAEGAEVETSQPADGLQSAPAQLSPEPKHVDFSADALDESLAQTSADAADPVAAAQYQEADELDGGTAQVLPPRHLRLSEDTYDDNDVYQESSEVGDPEELAKWAEASQSAAPPQLQTPVAADNQEATPISPTSPHYEDDFEDADGDPESSSEEDEGDIAKWEEAARAAAASQEQLPTEAAPADVTEAIPVSEEEGLIQVVVQDYAATAPGQLAVRRGVLVSVTHLAPSGWAFAALEPGSGGGSGWVPQAVVQRPLGLMQATAPCQAEGAGQLAVEAGAAVAVLRRSDSDEGLVYAQCINRPEAGWLPEEVLEPL